MHSPFSREQLSLECLGSSFFGRRYLSCIFLLTCLLGYLSTQTQTHTHTERHIYIYIYTHISYKQTCIMPLTATVNNHVVWYLTFVSVSGAVEDELWVASAG